MQKKTLSSVMLKVLMAFCVVVYIVAVLFFTDLTLQRHLLLMSPVAVAFLLWKKSRPVTGPLLVILVAVPLVLIGFSVAASWMATGLSGH